MTDNLNRQTVRYRQSALQKWQVFEFLHDKNLLISASLADINPAPQLYGFPLKIQLLLKTSLSQIIEN